MLPEPFDDEEFHDDPEPGFALALLSIVLILAAVVGACWLVTQ